MIYLAMDVCYHQTNNCAFAAGVRFTGVENVQTLSTHGTWVNEVLAYQSGQFYKREMPCLLALLKTINDPVDILVIDGFVYLNQGKSGLGKHLYDNLTDKKPIIGIAKILIKTWIIAIRFFEVKVKNHYMLQQLIIL